MGLQKNKKILIASVNASAYSETFIKAHIDLLDGEKFLVYGSYKPLYYSGKSLVLLLPLFKRFIRKYILKTDLLDYSIKRFLIKNKIDVILAEYGPTGCALMNISRELKIPLVVHFHGYDSSSLKLINEYRDSYKEMFRYANRIIAVSLLMQENLIKLGAERKKVVYDPYGPSPTFADIFPDYENSDTALFVGRFVDKKAPYLLIDIVKKITAKGINLRLIMAGDGELLETCKILAKINGLEKNILFPGAVNHDEVRRLMSNSFCYLQHSITTSDGETEGTPVSILEASLAGLAVISTKHAGIPDVIVHTETGFLVEEFDIVAMTEYLLLLNHNRQLAREMGTKAKVRIKENFSLERHISVLDKILESAVERY